MNSVLNNVIANVQRVGIAVNPDNLASHLVEVPISPGSSQRRETSVKKEVVSNFVGNEVYGASGFGIVLWGVGDRRLYYPGESGVNTITNSTIWNVVNAGTTLYNVDSVVIDGWLQRGDSNMIQRKVYDGGPVGGDFSARSGSGIWVGGANARSVVVKHADIQNMTNGFVNRGRGFADQIELSDSFLDNLFNIVNLSWTQDPSDGVRDFVVSRVRIGDSVSPGASNTLEMEWNPPTPYEATKRESVTINTFAGIDGLNLEAYYLEQAPGSNALNVPPGMLPAGIVAPVVRDGDNGDRAALRAKALGMRGLIFEKSRPTQPHLFANVELTSGKPTLYYATLGNTASVDGVKFKFGGREFASSSLYGSIDLSFLATGNYEIEGFIGDTPSITRNLVLPLRSVPDAANFNRPPVLTNIPNKSIVANHTLTFQLTGADPDLDSFHFEMNGLPSSATLTNSGVFSWTPTNSQAGEYFAEFKIIDSKGLSASQRVQFSVAFHAVDSLVGSWRLDSVAAGIATDSSVYGFHGVATNVTAAANGLRFNGINALIQVEPTLAHKPTQALTISADVKPIGGINSFSQIVGFESGSVSAYELSVKDGGFMRDDRGLMSGYWFFVNTTTGRRSVSWRNAIWPNTSYDSVVGVYDANKNGGWMAIYVNGRLMDELSNVGGIVYPPFGSQSVRIGGWGQYQGHFYNMFNGSLKNIKIISGIQPPPTSSNIAGRGEGEQAPVVGLEKQDVNGDGTVSPVDALKVINFLNVNGSAELDAYAHHRAIDAPNEVAIDQQWWWLDVNRDGFISPADALRVINRLNQKVIDSPENFDVAISQLVDANFGLFELRKRVLGTP